MVDKIRFGAYEVDTSKAELRKNGSRIRLQEQPFRILVMLLERPGEIVTREELKGRVWSDGTYVDFDQSLNKAVNRLREILSDDASRPRYIETVPRRGYRFVAHVQKMENLSGVPPLALETESSVRPRRRLGRKVAVTVVIVVTVCVVIFRLAINRTAVSIGAPELLLRDAFSPSFSSDGKLLSYVSSAGEDAPQVWVKRMFSGEAMPMTKGTGRSYFSELSPDGSQILIGSEATDNEVHLMPVFPGEATIPVPHARWCRFSADGETILCAVPENKQGPSTAADATVSLVLVTKGERQPIGFVNDNFQVMTPPIWSATGKGFLFWGRRKAYPTAQRNWWIADLATRTTHQLTLPGLKLGNGSLNAVHSWARQQNGNTFILYSSQDGETWRLYRVRVSDSGHAISRPELLSSGLGEIGSAGFANGLVVYSVGRSSEQLFQIPIDGYGRKRGPINELPLPEGPRYYSPSVSRAGDRLAYFQAEFGKPKSLIFKDLGSGRSRVLDNSVGPMRDGSASLSPDGSKIVFNRWCDMDGKPNCPSFLVPAGGGKPELLCENCQARGFSSNGSFVLTQKYASRAVGEGLDKITAVDLATKQERDVLSDPRHPVYHAFLSRDDRWIVFKRWISWTKSQIMMAPVREGRAAPEGEWVALTDGRFSDDKPQITSAADFVYFTSDRDGYLCVWAQRLDVRTKHPIDQPKAVEHFHNSMGRDAVDLPGNQSMVDLTMAADKLFINLPLRRADIWILALK